MLRWLLSSLFFTTIFIAFFSCSKHDPETLPKKYNAQYVDKALVIDGYINEIQWSNTNWSDPFVDIEGFYKPSPYFQTRMKIVWDKHYLYVAAELEEPLFC